jgi:splicing factor U2AF subunit
MLMLNMVTPDELVNDQDYQEILEDINDECSKYGEVEGVRVPRPVKRDSKWMPGESAAAAKQAAQKADEEAGVGRVYVLFKDLEGVTKALRAIAGRQFGGRTILCASVPEVRRWSLAGPRHNQEVDAVAVLQEEFLGPAPPPPPPAEPPSLDDAAAAAIADITG